MTTPGSKSKLSCESVARASLGEPVKRSGAELYWKCPRHDDAHPSLQVNIHKNVFMCAPCGASGTAWALAAFLANLNPSDKPAVSAWLISHNLLTGKREAKKDGRGPAVGEFVHHDVSGNPVCKKVRHEPGADGRDKDYLEWHFKDGGWKPGRGGVIPPLYRLPEIKNEPLVFVFESHTDVERAVKMNLPATTSGGSDSWRPEYAETLTGKDICLIPDSDEAGAKFTATVCNSLYAKAASLKVVSIAPYPDFRRWADAGGTMDTIFDLFDAAAQWRPAGITETLNEAARFIRRFVWLTEAQTVAGALWVAHTHAVEAATFTAYLHISSAEKGEGKSRLCKVLGLLAANVKKSDNISPAALVYTVDQGGVTLILDELDARLRGDQECAEILRGIINSGFERGGTYTRLEGEGSKRTVREWHTFSPKILSGIGRLWSTAEDRSIPIKMKRAKRGTVPRWRERGKAWAAIQAEANKTKTKLATWAEANIKTLSNAEPRVPSALSDRKADIAEPLLAIADAAGGGWPEAARRALVELCGGEQDAGDSIGTTALADARRVFNPQGGNGVQLPRLENVSSVDLAKAWHEMEDRPWPEYGRSRKPITPSQIARLFAPYGIGSRNLRFPDGRVLKGYEHSDFVEAWDRYLPPLPSSLTPVPPATSRYTATNRMNIGQNAVFEPLHEQACSVVENSLSANKDAPCSGVAATNGGDGGEGVSKNGGSGPESTTSAKNDGKLENGAPELNFDGAEPVEKPAGDASEF